VKSIMMLLESIGFFFVRLFIFLFRACFCRILQEGFACGFHVATFLNAMLVFLLRGLRASNYKVLVW
jgi:hypothetical protein